MDSSFSSATEFYRIELDALATRKESQGGFDFVASDIQVIRGLILKEKKVMEIFNWLDGNRFPQIPITERSSFNMAGEDYVKRYMLESWGVLCQVALVGQDKYQFIYWTMKGICPFHRRLHRNQHWIINEGKPNGDSVIQCFHPSKRFIKACIYPKAFVPKLPLHVPAGDGASYPVPRKYAYDSDG